MAEAEPCGKSAAVAPGPQGVYSPPVTQNPDSFARAADSLRARADQVVETPCALVFLIGARAFKLKKPVDFGYLDYSTPERRRWAAERELSFNRRTAPDVYLGLVEVEGEAVLEMRRFDQEAVLACSPERVDADLSEALGRTVARFHAGAKVAPTGGGSANLAYVLASNALLLRKFGDQLGQAAVERLIAETEDAFDAVSGLLEQRRLAGFTRDCHGDLHLANIFVEQDAPVLFDCIEFNDVLSEIDVLYDLAFLLMDLEFRGRRAAAMRVLNAYMDEAARDFGPELWRGLEALPLFLSVRAIVRCHVAGHDGDFELAARYLEAGLAFLERRPARLVAVGGLSGSGKTTHAREIAPGLGGSPGAVILRSDEIRKRLWGVGALERLPAEAYAAEVGERVYATLLEEARACLVAGRAVILDAVFLKPTERAAAEALAVETGVAFEGAWLEAAPEAMRARVAARTGDASDADAAVLDAQLYRDPGPLDWSRVTR